MQTRLSRWLKANTPSRESLENSRLLRPVAHRVLAPELWRFTRRSVPRGVALGLLVGILLLIPGLQIAGAALLALPFRANIPLAAAMTFLSNPATTPLILGASVYVGSHMLHTRVDISQLISLVHSHASAERWMTWLFSEAAPALLFGLLVISVGAAVIGYLLSNWLWQAHLGRKWRARRARVKAAATPISAQDAANA